MVTVVVALPETRPCVLRGVGPMGQTVPPRPCAVLSSAMGERDVCVAQDVVQQQGPPARAGHRPD